MLHQRGDPGAAGGGRGDEGDGGGLQRGLHGQHRRARKTNTRDIEIQKERERKVEVERRRYIGIDIDRHRLRYLLKREDRSSHVHVGRHVECHPV